MIPAAKGLSKDCYQPKWPKEQDKIIFTSLNIPKDVAKSMPPILKVLSAVIVD
jgi:hypothetical protein